MKNCCKKKRRKKHYKCSYVITTRKLAMKRAVKAIISVGRLLKDKALAALGVPVEVEVADVSEVVPEVALVSAEVALLVALILLVGSEEADSIAELLWVADPVGLPVSEVIMLVPLPPVPPVPESLPSLPESSPPLINF